MNHRSRVYLCDLKEIDGNCDPDYGIFFSDQKFDDVSG